jgi:hypothetical protein
MADIDAIIAGGAKTNADFDFGKINRSYWQGRDEFAKNDLRDAFKGGVPTLPDGSIDYATMQRTLYQKGALDQGNALSGISARAGELEALRGADGQSQPQVQPGPPSTSRNTVTPDPGKRMDAQPAQASQQTASAPATPSQQPTIMTVVAAQGFPNTELQKISESIARQLGVDPTAPLNLQDPQVRNVLAPAIAQFKRMNLGQVQPPQGAPQAPPVMAQAQPQAQPQAAPQGFQPPPNVAAAQNDPVLKRLTLLSASQDKQIAAAAKVRLEAYLKNQEPTGTMKEYHAAVKQGFKGTLEDWQNRADENTTQRDILTKSIIPRLEKSQEKASAARDDIDTLHRARTELDRPGGIFSGVLANRKLDLAKAGELFGFSSEQVANTEAFRAAAGQRVASLIKAFGSGTAISDGDRKFTQDIAAGNISLDEKSIRRLFDIGEKAGRLVIDRHNGLADNAVKANEGLKAARGTLVVEQPGQYKKAVGRGSTFASPADVWSAIEAGSLRKGDTFVDGNGKPRFVP